MRFGTSMLRAMALLSALAGSAAHASYVMEIDGEGIVGDAIADSAGFDFVAHDFGVETQDAVQITLNKLGNSINVRGNLLLRIQDDAGQLPAGETELPGLTAMTQEASTETVGSYEDFSYYDYASGTQAPGDAEGGSDNLDSSTLPLAPSTANLHNLPSIDTDTVFWILRPAEITSFSQSAAARFGF